MKHIKKFSIKNFGPPKTPPPQKKKLFMFGLFPAFEGKGGPKHKEFMESAVPWRGGSRRGVSGKIVYVYAFFRGLIFIDGGNGALVIGFGQGQF